MPALDLYAQFILEEIFKEDLFVISTDWDSCQGRLRLRGD